MAEPVTQGQFFETMRHLRAEFESRDNTIRLDIQNGFRDLRESFEQHAREDRILADRILMIETERRGEKETAIRRGAWAGILGGSAVAAVSKWLERILMR